MSTMMRGGPEGASPLLTTSFAALIGTMFFCYAQYFVTLPLIPLMVLAIGGDAALIGAVVAALAVSSLALRVFIGHLVDRWSLKGTLAIGALTLGVTGFAYALPSVPVLFLNRIMHGAGWAAINTAGAAAAGAVSPPGRRGEVAGYFLAMPGLAQGVMPAVALAILPAAGFAGAFGVAGLSGLCAAALVSAIRLPPRVQPAVSPGNFWSGLLDRSVFRPMSIEALSTSAEMLFIVFVPLRAIEIDVPVGSLGVYFVVIGATRVISVLSLGRLSDRLGRGPVMALGGLATLLGIVLLATATDLLGLAAAGVAYALGRSLVSPATFALAADRMNPARRGAAFAAYSMAFPLANGLGGLLWGVMIQVSGFSLAFVSAFLMQALLIVLSLQVFGTLRDQRGPT